MADRGVIQFYQVECVQAAFQQFLFLQIAFRYKWIKRLIIGTLQPLEYVAILSVKKLRFYTPKLTLDSNHMLSYDTINVNYR